MNHSKNVHVLNKFSLQFSKPLIFLALIAVTLTLSYEHAYAEPQSVSGAIAGSKMTVEDESMFTEEYRAQVQQGSARAAEKPVENHSANERRLQKHIDRIDKIK
jgi:hypothetical protein